VSDRSFHFGIRASFVIRLPRRSWAKAGVSIIQASGRFVVSFRRTLSDPGGARSVASGKGDNAKVVPPSPSTVILQSHHIAHLLEQFFRLAKRGSSGRTMAMIRLLSGCFLAGKRIRPNNSAHFSLGRMTDFERLTLLVLMK
jgi:hypothetical protein